MPRKRQFLGGRPSVGFDEEDMSRLRRIADRDQVSISDVVRRIVRVYLYQTAPSADAVPTAPDPVPA